MQNKRSKLSKRAVLLFKKDLRKQLTNSKLVVYSVFLYRINKLTCPQFLEVL